MDEVEQRPENLFELHHVRKSPVKAVWPHDIVRLHVCVIFFIFSCPSRFVVRCYLALHVRVVRSMGGGTSSLQGGALQGPRAHIICALRGECAEVTHPPERVSTIVMAK